jgi:hypothetical protein
MATDSSYLDQVVSGEEKLASTQSTRQESGFIYRERRSPCWKEAQPTFTEFSQTMMVFRVLLVKTFIVN